MKATYVRVSTFEQNITRQLDGKDGQVYWNKVSCMVAFEDREDAARLLADAEVGKIEEVQVHSIDRFGRDAINVLQTIKRFTELGVNVKSKRKDLPTYFPADNKTRWPSCWCRCCPRWPRSTTTTGGKPRRKGSPGPKPKAKYKGQAGGSGMTPVELIDKHNDIRRELNSVHSIRRTAKLTRKAKSTVQRVKKALKGITA